MQITSKTTLFDAMNNITSFDALKAFEAAVMQMAINHDLRNRLLRQATENFCNACPAY